MTPPSPDPELDRLFSALVDEQWSDADEAALQSRLRDDFAARRRYVQFMQLHAELHWDHGAAASWLANPEVNSAAVGPAVQRSAKPIGSWMTLAIIAGTVAAGLLFAGVHFTAGDGSDTTAQAAPPIANVEMMHGTASFRTAGGETLVLSGREQALTAGTLLVEGEWSAVQWRFRDATLITVSGDAEVGFTDDGQKLLRVRQGMLTAEVQPQSAGSPLVVETPTARVEVLGTVFSLAAEPDETRVNVAEGRVRLKRLVDGETVEVTGKHTCVATLDARGALRPEVPDQPTSGWQYRFHEPPPPQWKGEWLPAEGGAAARVRAVACLVGRKHEADYTPVVHYGITARRVDGMSLGSLPTQGRLRVRYRTQQPASLHIMLGLDRDDGGFGGNFEVKLRRDAGTPREGGWRELVVPLADFRPVAQRQREMPQDARPHLILITTFGDDAGLEVSELAIEGAEKSGVR